ncbi:S-adenosyl-L-methionine-dependent methyltransferase [Trichocladium antarcticum]|uniref:S-adenosyl-L-methionine-dependent methyltransferase n=1 Tax=Trichocladium antarcticum TaxID=1450529 RepID=A0AAN6ZBI7_9PEZI|nr:S-adenosyl-L-methionine-dependent methyltransferase [Trichocladium antarcticum]
MADTPPKSPASPAPRTPSSAGSHAAAAPAAPATPAQATSPRALAAVPASVGVLEADASVHQLPTGAISDTASLTSSIFRYRVENGRRYHAYKEGSYYMPNDDRESERLDLQHNLNLLMQDNQLYICPAGKDPDKPLRRVLDGGCGTGIWSIELADECPETAVVGVDLSPIQPGFVPPNVEFFVDDLEAEWTYVSRFDLVYLRHLNGSIRDWDRLVGQAYQHLAPGGYLEMCETVSPLRADDGSLPADSALGRWSRLIHDAAAAFSSPIDAALRHRQRMADAGFRNVTQVEYRWPTNPWPRDAKYKDVGSWCYFNLLDSLQAASLFLFTNVLGWSPDAVEVFLVDVRKDLKNRNIHAYFPVLVVYGQKPE